jgi:hypothetical protein
MRIRSVQANNHKKCFEVTTAKGDFSLPYARCQTIPTSKDPVSEVFVDPELAHQAITYRLASGKADSIPLDAFLDYGRDPEYLAKMVLYRLTQDAIDAVKQSGIGIRALSRRLNTSPTQIYRLLDPKNPRKTIDQVLKLLSALGYEVDFDVRPEPRRRVS